jgi:hypothetical protein
VAGFLPGTHMLDPWLTAMDLPPKRKCQYPRPGAPVQNPRLQIRRLIETGIMMKRPTITASSSLLLVSFYCAL